MGRDRRRVFVRGSLVLVLGLVLDARALGDPGDDGLYGRFEGDLTLSAGVGATASRTAEVAPSVELRARHLDTAGLVVAGELGASGASVFGGVDLRPLFPGLFLANRSTGSAWLDLLVGSLGLDAGLVRYDRSGVDGLAWRIALGADVPVWFDPRSGARLTLRISAAHVRSTAAIVAGGGGSLSDWAGAAMVTFTRPVRLGLAGAAPAFSRHRRESMTTLARLER